MKANIKMRVARPTDNLIELSRMYEKGLGFKILSQFKDHQGFDGVILGIPNSNYHIEFTSHKGSEAGKAPTKDNLLVFYINDKDEWEFICSQMEDAGFKIVSSFNPYWDVNGKTFEDLDGYRVVLQNQSWDR